MKSGYSLRSITTRVNGPAVSSTYFLGYFREDYEFISSTQTDVLDEHNGRWCKTPEYLGGTYAYFCTVDENWNSAYPYAVGPTFYGVYARRTATSVPSGTTTYTSSVGLNETEFNNLKINVFPNPASDLIAIQINGLNKENLQLKLYSMQGKLIQENKINPGATVGYFDVQTLYNGVYLVEITNGTYKQTKKVVVRK